MLGVLRSSRAPRLAAVLVVAVGVLCAVVIAIRTPAWESNDEPDHVRNIEILASGHWYKIEDGAGYSPHQPPLYYLAMAGLQRVAGMRAELPMPQQGDGTTDNGQFGHAQPQEHHDHRRLLLLRFPSVILGALTVIITGRVARALGGDAWTETAAMATVAFIPKFVFSSSFVNNDVLATTLGAAVTLLAVRMWRGERTTRLAVGLGVASGALLGTKLSAIPLVGVVAIAVLWRWRRSAKELVACAIPAVALAGPVFVSNQLRYGDPVAAKASIDYFRTWIPALVAVPRTFRWFGRTVASGAATSFWYTSGWNQFRWKAVTYVPLWGLSVLALLAHPIRRARAAKGTGLAFLVVIAAAASIWVLAWNTTQWQARIAFPGLAAFGALIATGWRRWGAPVWLSFVLPALGLVGTLYAIRTDVFGRY